MPREFNQKIKLLRIIELLRMETDEQHPLTTREICGRLNQSGIPCERRTLSRDMAVLRENGYDIRSEMTGHEKAYYDAGTHFTGSELKQIENAVEAAAFISKDKTDILVKKIASLAGASSANLLEENNIVFDTVKPVHCDHEEVLDILTKAVSRNGMISFVCEAQNNAPFASSSPDIVSGNITEDGSGPSAAADENAASDERSRIAAYPDAVVCADGGFSLLCTLVSDGSRKMYGVDSISDIRVSRAGPEGSDPDTDHTDHKQRVRLSREQILEFAEGREEECVLEFAGELETDVRRRFGDYIYIERTPQGICRARVQARTNPSFWGWIFKYSGLMQIIHPRELAVRYMTWCNVIAQSIAESLTENN